MSPGSVSTRVSFVLRSAEETCETLMHGGKAKIGIYSTSSSPEGWKSIDFESTSDSMNKHRNLLNPITTWDLLNPKIGIN
jgi:hypothetical protein